MTEPIPAAGAPAADRARLLRRLLRERGLPVADDAIPSRRREPGLCPLSFSQQGLWIEHRIAPESPAYNITFALRLAGPLRLEVLERSLTEILRRHEALRTVFAERGGEPFQEVLPAAPVHLPVVDLAGLPEGVRTDEAGRLASDEASRSFALAQGPLLRASALRLAVEDHVTLFTVHHIAFDGWSLGIFLREMGELYIAYAAGRPAPLPDLPLQYGDYAVWQRRRLNGERLESELAWWRRQLAGMPPVLELPADRSLPPVRSFRGADLPFTFRPEDAARLRDLARDGSVTLFMILLAGFEALLSRHTGQRDFAVATPVAGRDHVELEGLIGLFANTLVVRAELHGDPSFRELLGRAREAWLAAQGHQEVPFERLVAELEPQRNAGRPPFVQAVLAFQNAGQAEADLPGLAPGPIGTGAGAAGTAKFDLLLVIEEEGGGGLVGRWQYSTDLFDATTMARMAGHFGRLLMAAAEHPEMALSDLPLLSSPERWQLVGEWNDTRSSFPVDRTLHGLFVERARRWPEAPAVSCPRESLTYAALDRRSDAIARRLCAFGIGPEAPVALLLERSSQAIAALLGILKAGGAYVPLDPSHPDERLARLIADCGAEVLVTSGEIVARLPRTSAGVAVVDLDESTTEVGEEAAFTEGQVDRLACVMYTSGSTGHPKGVAVSHRNVLRLVEGADYACFGPDEVAFQLAPLSFDASTFEIWGCLLHGGRLVVAPELGSLAGLGQEIARQGITTLWLTAGLFHSMVEEAPEILRSVRQLLAGGDALSLSHVRRLLAAGGRLVNGYGPTEGTTFTCCQRVAGPEALAGSVPIGRPISNARAHVLDRDLRPVPLGASGELCAAGDGLARGYLGRPDLTAERFIPDPFAPAPGGRLYRTGDRVRYLRDGRLEFLGRFDQQLKLRGFRVEPGEVEAALTAQPGIAAAAVVTREDQPGDRRLVAYVVPREGDGVATAELLADLRGRLPEFMVPSAVVLLAALPLTPNGKVNRRALPAPPAAAAEPVTRPSHPVEEVVAAVWADVLGIEAAGPNDDFFALGGHSLSATRAASRLRDAFGVELPLRAFFEAPTVAGCAREVEARLRAGHGAAAPPIAPVPRGTGLPLSFAQQRLWFLDQLQQGNAVYNIPLVLRLGGQLNPEALAWSLGEIGRRHEALRTVFMARDGSPVQVPLPPAPFPLPRIDLSGLTPAVRDSEAVAQACEEAARPFDLSTGPLWRGLLLRLGPGDHALVLTLHHIAGDGWSVQILERELAALYCGAAASEPAPLPELPVQYADFAVWQRRWIQGEPLERNLAYWRRQLAGAPPLHELPTDRPRPAAPTLRGGTVALRLAPELAPRLRELGRRHGATLFMTVLAGFKALLARISGMRDVSVGTPIAGRNRAEVEPLIGFFVNTLVLRTLLDGEATFGELLGRVRQTALAAYMHQDLPFERLVEELQPERSLSHAPLFQVSFDLAQRPAPRHGLAGLECSRVEVVTGTAKFDLSLVFEESPEGFVAAAEHSADLFDVTTVVRLLAHLERLLIAAAGDPGLRIRELPLLGPAERAQLLQEWNDTTPPWREEICLHVLVERQADLRPGDIALVADGGEQLTYGELEKRSNRLARYLARLDIGPEVPVGIYLNRCPALIVALLGILKAGGTCLPIEPASPRERTEMLLEDAKASLILTEERFEDRLPYGSMRICFDRDRDRIARESPERPSSGVKPSNLAYILYTSGSTGHPKGVAIEHRSLARYVTMAADRFELSSADRVLHFASPAFDISIEEIYCCLSQGATLVLATPEMTLSSTHFLERCHDLGVTVICPATAFWHEILIEVSRNPSVLPPSLRLVSFGGERVLPELVSVWWRRIGPRVRLFNTYGPTETTVACSVYEVRDASGLVDLPIGRPHPGVRIYVLDRLLETLPLGAVGEICVAGAGIARGYLDRPDATALRFVPDPFAAIGGGRLYRTGDLGRHLQNGELAFVGRSDRQVKIRGHRIEPGEIETALVCLRDIQEAVVLPWDRGRGDRRLVAYVVPEPGIAPEAAELRRMLREMLPDYMVPDAFVIIEALPLTTNGKLDWRRLPAPGEARREIETSYVAPRTPVEEIMAGIWGEVLGIALVGAQDDFFELGGHSLLATQVVSRLRSIFGLELPLRNLFEEPTLAGLSARIERSLLSAAGVAPPPPIERTARAPEFPLSFTQQRLWFIERLSPGLAVYNLPVALRLSGLLRVEVLGRALAEIARRHEALRTVFTAEDGVPMQVILPEVPARPAMVDLSGLTGDREAAAREVLDGEAWRPFDLERSPLFRTLLLRLGADDHALLLAMHHIVSDGWSVEVLIRELSVLYAAFAEGRPSPLPEPPVQYADYAVWQRRWLTSEILDRHLAWWRDRLAGAPPILELPADRPRPVEQSFRGEVRTLRLAGDVAEALRTLSRRRGATLFMTLLASFQGLLGRWCGAGDIVVGTPVAGRQHLETEGLVGFFVNTLVLRTDLRDDPSFRNLLDRVRESALAAYAHQEVPFERLVEELRPERSLRHAPLVQVTFQLAPPRPNFEPPPGLRLSFLPLASRTAKVDLALTFEEEDGLQAGIDYALDLFDGTTIERLAGHLAALLAAAAADPDRSLSELPLLTVVELHQLLAEWSDTAVAYAKTTCLHEPFAVQAEACPDAVAVASGGIHLTYGELARRSRALAQRLHRLGVGPEGRVGVCVERSPEMIVAFLGILEAGGVYVPLDPEYPRERLAFLLRDAAVGVLLADERSRHALPETPVPVLSPIAADLEMGEDVAGGSPGLAPDHSAYVLYTSGSTGLPKGVVVSHRAITYHMLWMQSVFPLTPDDRVLQSTSTSFDASVWEIFAPLLAGARLELAPPGARRDPARLIEAVATAGVTVLQVVPSLLEALLDEPGLAGCAGLRRLFCGGEELSPQLKERCLATLPVSLVNLYGPTEATIHASTRTFASRDGEASVPLGRPIHNARLHIVDAGLRQVPVGAAGELLVGGAGLARGYLGRPSQTAERFVPDPFAAEPGARLYRTGDRARWSPRGEVEFLGRLDHQVKLRGFRIEPGEVEAALAAHPGVRQAAVVVREVAPSDQRLVAYVVGGASTTELRSFLRERLPVPMVPAAFVHLAALPLTPNGKLDRAALPAPQRSDDSGPAAPRDRLELELAHLWEEILGVGPVGPGDSFFELGGHSLLAVRLFARIEARFGVRLPLGTLFQNPTVEHLAELLRRDYAASPASVLVTIRRGGSLPPLFWMHPAGGDVLCYARLAHLLPGSIPVYALQALAPEDGGARPVSVGEMAALYCEEVRSVQPHGPYRLAGWSLGGLIAFEVARQLADEGDTTELLLLVDSSLPPRDAPVLDPRDLLWMFAQTLGLTAAELSDHQGVFAGVAPEEALSRLFDAAADAGVLARGIDIGEIRRRYAMYEANVRAMLSWMPQPYPGRALVVRALDEPLGPWGETMGWERFCMAGVEVLALQGSHFTVLREPYVGALAELVRERLAQLAGNEP